MSIFENPSASSTGTTAGPILAATGSGPEFSYEDASWAPINRGIWKWRKKWGKVVDSKI
jgi:hypothetical protein